MTARWGTVIVPINETNHQFWYLFKATCQKQGIPYTRAMAQAAALWLAQRPPLGEAAYGETLFRDPAPVSYDPERHDG